MLQDKLNKIEKAIAEAENLSEERKQELEKLASELRAELTELEKTQKEQANNIADSTERAVTGHVCKTEQGEASSSEATENLKSVIRQFEASHPNLTRIINSICVAFEV